MPTTPWHPGAKASLMIPPGGFQYLVIVAAAGANLSLPGPGISAVFAKGWPDARGEANARATIDGGGTAIFEFTNADDARACLRRIAGRADVG